MHWKAPPCVDHFILTVVHSRSHNIEKLIGFAYLMALYCNLYDSIEKVVSTRPPTSINFGAAAHRYAVLEKKLRRENVF